MLRPPWGRRGFVGLKIHVQVLCISLTASGRPPLDPEMLLELQEELVGVLVRPTAVLAPVVVCGRPQVGKQRAHGGLNR